MSRSVYLALMLAIGGLFGQSVPSITVNGSVLETGTSRPLEGVKVWLHPSRDLVAITDRQGTFSLKGPVGRHRIVVESPGFVSARSDGRPVDANGLWINLRNGVDTLQTNLWMSREAVVSGSVVDASGKPLTGFEVTLSALKYGYNAQGVKTLGGWELVEDGFPVFLAPIQSRPSDRGEFRLFGMAQGTYYIKAFVPSRSGGLPLTVFFPGTTDETKAVAVRVNSGEELKLSPFVIPAQSSISQVRLNIANANKLQSQRDVFVNPGGALFLGDGDQAADHVLLSLAPGPKEVILTSGRWLVPDEFSYGRVSLEVDGRDIVQDVVLRPALPVTATVFLNSEGGKIAPLEGVKCTLTSYPAMPQRARALAGGQCLNARVLPSVYHLTLRGLSSEQYIASATVEGRDVRAGIDVRQETVIRVLVSSDGASIRGVAVDHLAKPVDGATVVLVPDPPIGAVDLYQSNVSDILGEFEILGIAPGNYRLSAWKDLAGVVYRNPEFHLKSQHRGLPLTISPRQERVVSVVAVDFDSIEDEK